MLVAGAPAEPGEGSFFTVLRYRPDGSRDERFSDDGQVSAFVGRDSAASTVGLDARGRVLAAGRVSSGRNLALLRYLPDGSLDPGFSGDGMQITHSPVTAGWVPRPWRWTTAGS